MCVLGVEVRVVEGHRGAVGEVLHDRQVLGQQFAPAREAQEGERPQHVPAGGELDDHRGAVAGAAHEAHVLLALRRLPERGGVGEVVHLQGLLRAQRVSHGVGAPEHGWLPSAQLLQTTRQPLLLGGGDGVADRAVLAEEVDHAEVGELGNRGAGDGLDGLQGIEGGVEGGGGGDEQVLRLGRSAQLGDLADHRRQTRGVQWIRPIRRVRQVRRIRSVQWIRLLVHGVS